MNSAGICIITLAIVLMFHHSGVLSQVEKPYTMPTTPEEAKKCETPAKGRNYTAKKNGIWPCTLKCFYGDNTDEIVPLDDQTPCCPVGPAPTGVCKNATCNVGGAVPLKTK